MSFTKEDELGDSQVAELRDLFFKFDTDRSGTVAFEHVDEILRTAARVITDPEFKKLVKSTVPADLEKKVQFPEFVDMVSKHTRAFNPAADLHDAFRVFDRDGHGFITTAELRHVVTTLGERMTEEEADELIREADANNEGHVDYEEFIKTISKPLPPGEYGVPPKKKEPPPAAEVPQEAESVTSPTSAVPAEMASAAVSEAPPPGEVQAPAAGAEMSEKSGPTSAPAESSERPSEGAAAESGQGSKSSGKGSASGSGKGSGAGSGKGSGGGSGKGSGGGSGKGSGAGSGKGSASGSGSASRKSSGKGSGGGSESSPAGSAGPVGSAGPPVEVVAPDPPAEKTSGKIEKR